MAGNIDHTADGRRAIIICRVAIPLRRRCMADGTSGKLLYCALTCVRFVGVRGADSIGSHSRNDQMVEGVNVLTSGESGKDH